MVPRESLINPIPSSSQHIRVEDKPPHALDCTIEPVSGETPDAPLLSKKAWRRVAVGLLLALAAGFLVVHFTMDETGWERLRSFPRQLFPVILAMVGGAWLCNGLRTWFLARALGHRISMHRAVGITLSMEFAIAATPGGVGGLATRIGLQRQAGIPLPHTMTMIAGDAAADILFFLLLAPMAIRHMMELGPVRSLWEQIHWLAFVPWAVSALAALALGGWLISRLRMTRLVRALPHRWRQEGRLEARWNRVRRSGKRQIREMGTAARFLARERRSYYVASFFLAGLQWSCRYGVLPVVLWGLGSPVDPFALVFVQGALFLVGLLVVAPGGGGSLEILTTLILKPLVGASVGALAVVLWRLFTYYLYLAGGACAFATMVCFGGRGKKTPPASADNLS